MKRVLVTGATGFVGSHLAERLLAQGRSLRVLARDARRLRPIIAQQAEIIVGDLQNKYALEEAVIDCDVVFHCAAKVDTWGTWDDYAITNIQGVGNLLAAMVAQGKYVPRLVHLSSMDVYGFPQTPCDETEPLNGAGFGYGTSKASGEAIIHNYATRHALAFVILRPGNIIGPRSQFIERIGAELRSGLMLKVDGGRAHAGMTSIQTLCDVMLWAASDRKAVGQCYNVRDAGEVTWAEFLAAFQDILGKKGRVIKLPFAVAEMAARGCEFVYRLAPHHEPLLHRLFVRIFGRSCGHSIAKLQRDSGLRLRGDFQTLMSQSVGPLTL